MKKILALVLILVVVALCVFAALNTDSTNSTTDAPLSDVEMQEAINSGAIDTDDASTASVMYDADGKAYFVGDEYAAYQLALDADMQERMDLAIIGNFMVYDIIRTGDSTMVDGEGKEINLRYGISEDAIPAEVTVLRDGFAVFTWDENEFEVSDKTDKVFVGASDSKFAEKVYCAEHKAIFAREITGYPEALEWAEGNKKGLRGPFDTDKLDNDIFDAFVLVRRVVNVNGENRTAFTWVVRTCGCNQPGGEPSQPSNPIPTDAPTFNPQPTQAPTEAPTPTPTDAPTQAPTDAPTQAPTDAPTQAPTEAPTQEPTVAPSFNPQPTQAAPTVTVAPTATSAPTVKPTFNPQPTQAAPVVTDAPTATPAPTEEPPKFNFGPEQDEDNSGNDEEEQAPSFNFGGNQNGGNSGNQSGNNGGGEEQAPSFSFGGNQNGGNSGNQSGNNAGGEEQAPSFSFGGNQNSGDSGNSDNQSEQSSGTPSFGFGSGNSNSDSDDVGFSF